MVTAYRLSENLAHIASLQAGMLADSNHGLKNTHGLIGSEEWWAQVRSGKITTHVIEGVISAFWPGQFGDGPAEFQIRQSDGSTSIWLCEIEPLEAKELFIIGHLAKLEYVVQQLKFPFNGNHDSNVTLSIQVS